MKKAFERFFKRSFTEFYKLLVVPQIVSSDELPLKDIKKILVILRHQMGDMLVALPMLHSLRDYYKTQHIALLTKSSSNYHLLFTGESSPVDEVIKYEYGFENLLKTIKDLEYQEYDLAIIPSTTSFSSTNHLAAYLAKVKIRAGTASIDMEINPYEKFLNIKSDFEWRRKRTHQVEKNLDIIRQLKIPVTQRNIKITVNEENQKFADDFIAEHFPDNTKLKIGFHPGAGKRENVWSPGNFAKLADMLSEAYDPYFFISHGPKDEQWVDELTVLLKEKKLKTYKGVLLKDIAIISKLDLFITNDTGVMHLSSGLQVPVISLFGPTKAYEWGPLGENKYSIQSRNGLMDGIKTDVVFNTCRDILSRQKV